MKEYHIASLVSPIIRAFPLAADETMTLDWDTREDKQELFIWRPGQADFRHVQWSARCGLASREVWLSPEDWR